MSAPSGSTGEPVRYDGRVAVVTGSGRNLGRLYALWLAERGARVVVNDIGVAISDTDGSGNAPSSNPAHDVVAEILSAGGEAVASTESIATVEGGAAIVAKALDTWGRIDIVINNAGVVRQAPFPDVTPELLDPVLETQIGGVFNVTRPAWRHMAQQGYGRILNLSSGAAIYGIPNMAPYAAGKAAVMGLTREMAAEGRPLGITVNALMPMAKTRYETGLGPIPASPELFAWFGHEYIAPLALWLVHQHCDVTGEIFTVGAGYMARVLIGVNDGFTKRPLTIEDVRDNMHELMAESPVRVLHLGEADSDRMLRGFDPPSAG